MCGQAVLGLYMGSKIIGKDMVEQNHLTKFDSTPVNVCTPHNEATSGIASRNW